MSLDTSKTVESVTYNGVAFTLKGGGATTASEVSYTNANLEGVTNAQGALDALVGSKTQAETDIEALGSAIDSMDTRVKKNTTDISTLASNQETFTQDVDTLNTQYTALNEKAHTHTNKDCLDSLFVSGSGEDTQLGYRYGHLNTQQHLIQIVPKIEPLTFSIQLDNNKIYQGLAAGNTSCTVTFPENVLDTYMSELTIKFNVTPQFSYPTGIIWSGIDINNGQFVPVMDKYYDIIFWKNSFGFNAAVRGVWV